MARISVTVDGTRYVDDVEPRTLLVHYLRDHLGKVGTVVGCDTSNCGACTVLMTTPGSGALTTDLALMTAVAAKIDARNEEVRAMLRIFIGQMNSVPSSVWGGVAALRFREVVDRWDAESTKLYAALTRIAETIRNNERTLRAVADAHSHDITAATGAL